MARRSLYGTGPASRMAVDGGPHRFCRTGDFSIHRSDRVRRAVALVAARVDCQGTWSGVCQPNRHAGPKQAEATDRLGHAAGTGSPWCRAAVDHAKHRARYQLSALLAGGLRLRWSRAGLATGRLHTAETLARRGRWQGVAGSVRGPRWLAVTGTRHRRP